MNVGPHERAVALTAIRQTGGELTEPVEAWAGGVPGRRQIYVTARSAALQRGEVYDTWLVTLAADGSVLSVECFRSTACR